MIRGIYLFRGTSVEISGYTTATPASSWHLRSTPGLTVSQCRKTLIALIYTPWLPRGNPGIVRSATGARQRLFVAPPLSSGPNHNYTLTNRGYTITTPGWSVGVNRGCTEIRPSTSLIMWPPQIIPVIRKHLSGAIRDLSDWGFMYPLLYNRNCQLIIIQYRCTRLRCPRLDCPPAC